MLTDSKRIPTQKDVMTNLHPIVDQNLLHDELSFLQAIHTAGNRTMRMKHGVDNRHTQRRHALIFGKNGESVAHGRRCNSVLSVWEGALQAGINKHKHEST